MGSIESFVPENAIDGEIFCRLKIQTRREVGGIPVKILSSFDASAGMRAVGSRAYLCIFEL